MSIPDKALEAAREALVKRGLLAVGDAAEIALEAAAPFIAAQALRDLANDFGGADAEEAFLGSEVYDEARRRADELDEQ